MSGNTDIAFIAGRDPFEEVSGGHSSYVRSYARAAIAAGFMPHLFCVGRSNERRETEIGVLHRVASPYRPFRQMAAAMHARPLSAALTAFAAGSRRPLLIHSFGVWGIAAVRAAPMLLAGGVMPILVQSSYTTYRDETWSQVRGARWYGLVARLRFAASSWWVGGVVERWERRAYRAARTVLVNYESVARLVRERHGAQVTCRVMPYAAEAAFRDRVPAPRNEAGLPRILCIARHEPRKGNDVLLRGLAEVKAAGVSFEARLVGGGPLLAEHRALAAKLGLGGSVVIEGIVPDVQPLLEAADLFVLPSREEQSGSLAILEALQHGLAIVASAVDGILEDLSPDDALLVPPGAENALAVAIVSVLSSASLRVRLQARSRELFERRFAAAPFAASLGAIYRELLEEGKC